MKQPDTCPAFTFKLGDTVTKVSGSSWTGRVVGFYSTELTPEGYCVESLAETGSVQIYPAKALALVEEECKCAVSSQWGTPVRPPPHRPPEPRMKQPQNIEWDFFGRGPPKAPGLYAVAWMGGTQRGAAFDVPVYGVRVRGTEGWPAHLIAFAGPFGSEEDAEIWINEVGDWEHPR